MARTIKIIFICISGLLLSHCLSQKTVQKKEKKQEAKKTAVEKKQPGPVFLLQKETHFYNDDAVFLIIEYAYDKQKLIKVSEKDDSNTVLKYSEYVYEKSSIIENITDTMQKSTIKKILKYQEIGQNYVGINVLEESVYEKDKKLRSQIKYEYDKNNQLQKSLIYTEQDILNYKVNYEYDSNGKKSRIVYMTPADLVDQTTSYEYSADGKQVKEIFHDNQNKLIKARTHYYQKKLLMKTEHFNSSKALLYVEVYDYDEKNNLIKKSILDQAGVISEYIVYEYIEHKN